MEVGLMRLPVDVPPRDHRQVPWRSGDARTGPTHRVDQIDVWATGGGARRT